MIVPVTYFLQHVLPREGSRSLFFTAHAFTQVYRSVFFTARALKQRFPEHIFYRTCAHPVFAGTYSLQGMLSRQGSRNPFFTAHWRSRTFP